MKSKLKLRILAFVMLVIVVSSMLCACGSDSVYAGNEAVSDSASSFGVEDSMSKSSGSSADGESSDASLKDSRKIIETIYYSVQTKNFDDLVSKLEAQASQVGGYIEQSDVSGNKYDDITARYASYTFKIPSDKVDEFTNVVSENSTITNRTVNTEDVTLEYVDVESRIKALNTEKASLEELLKTATSTAEIIEIRDMLTDVIYEIESYESQLRTFDSLIDYTTITIDIDEVEYVSVVSEQTVWQRIGSNLSDNFRNLWNFLVEVFVALVSGLPYFIFIGIIVAIIVVIIKLTAKKRKQKRANNPRPVQSYTNPVPYMPQPTAPDTQNNKTE